MRHLSTHAALALGLLSLASVPPAVAQQDDHDHHAHEHDHSHDHGHKHEHNHSHDHHDSDIYAGYFDDDQVEDRTLSDWEGDWQSVYPYLQDGTLDNVFAHKAAQGDDKTAADYKQYYTTGYRTDIDRIVIEGDQVSFYEDGDKRTGEYSYDGHEILTYEAGNRGVRYIFERDGGNADAPRYIQFSDHAIYPTDADHYHLYWGDDRAALLDEVTNWPTYYPSDLNGDAIAREMMAH
ncbi:ZinT family metal-binding protein [Chromohalobacter canadensis]|uniref:Metal-binding protein ZinT n=1 Tax=Chromohalobacter canadensis TaxID=141389 RepID=A0ABZ0YEC2_9GAMM|nr:metal-binding protein ZinT [Chromohalobacter canadensis]MCK0770272.1 metal-binding protein ZinT [Chromohalobacter canadensis]WQH10438.1 metal-binding protein ZinT [Chromohalobacter canadensis]